MGWQGIIQKKSVPSRQMLPLAHLTKKCPFSQNGIMLRYLWVKLSQKFPFLKDFGCCPKILDYTLDGVQQSQSYGEKVPLLPWLATILVMVSQ